jgi:hypothetical protein
MTREEAVEVARAFVAKQPHDWRQEWPAKRLATKRKLSSQTKEEVWEVRSLRDGFDRPNIFVEVSVRTTLVSYALKGGGLREQWQEYRPA